MELLVFDVEDNLNQIYRQDIESDSGEYELEWSADGKKNFINSNMVVRFSDN